MEGEEAECKDYRYREHSHPGRWLC